jgi:hypothetical protein
MNRLLFIFFVTLLAGCFYPKVHVDKDKRRLISYDKKKPIVFYSNSGLYDTVRFYNIGYKKGYEPNFDCWWGTKLADRGNTKPIRGYYYSVSAISNFPKNKYSNAHLNLSLHLRLIKQDNSKELTLTIEEFEEKYIINDSIADTLIFSKPVNPEKCNVWNCFKRVVWTGEQGIVVIEKNDGTIWRRTSPNKSTVTGESTQSK